MVLLLLILIEDVSTLLMLLKDCCRSAFRCYCDVVCISQLPLPLPFLLSDVCVPVATAVVFLLYLEGGCHGDRDVDRGRVDLIDVDNGLLRSETNKRDALDCSFN